MKKLSAILSVAMMSGSASALDLLQAYRDALVYTVEQGKAKAVPIKIAQLFDDKVVVSSGLESVERVVTIGAPYLADGAPVKEE